MLIVMFQAFIIIFRDKSKERDTIEQDLEEKRKEHEDLTK